MVKFRALPRTPRIQALRAAASQKWADVSQVLTVPGGSGGVPEGRPDLAPRKTHARPTATLPKTTKNSPAVFISPEKMPEQTTAKMKAAANEPSHESTAPPRSVLMISLMVISPYSEC